MSTKALNAVCSLGNLICWRRLGALPAFLLAGIGVLAAADLHTFTNKSDGRTIDAAIISVTATDVSVKRSDGQTFKIPLSTLSDTDQDFVAQWAVKQAQAMREVFDFSTEEIRTDNIAGAGTLTSWTSGFKVTLNSKVNTDLKNLKVQYVLLWERQVFIGTADPLQKMSGTATIDVVPELAAATFETKKATLRSEDQETYGGFNMTAKKTTVKDTMKAVWIRISDNQGNLLEEWSSSPPFTSKLNWNDVYSTAPPSGSAPGFGPRAGRG